MNTRRHCQTVADTSADSHAETKRAAFRNAVMQKEAYRRPNTHIGTIGQNHTRSKAEVESCKDTGSETLGLAATRTEQVDQET
jgi:uncharacterized protein YqkB